MNKFKNIRWPLIILFIFLNHLGVAVGDEIQFGPKEAYILVDRLLGLSPEPLSNEESLARYDQWADVYAKYSKKKLLTMNEMKVYLLTVLIAEERVLIHTQEEICEELVPKFERQPEVFLAVLKDLPFLIPTACKYLKEHFLFTNQPDQRHQFAKKHRKIIVQHLGEEMGSECLREITKEISGL